MEEEYDADRAAEVEWQKRRDKSRKIHLAKDVDSMKEEVPPWINSVIGKCGSFTPYHVTCIMTS